jgi:hypothetical protein
VVEWGLGEAALETKLDLAQICPDLVERLGGEAVLFLER